MRNEILSKVIRRAFLLIIISLFVFLYSAKAQNVQFGVRGGIDVTEMEFNGDVMKTTNRAGFFVGPLLRITTPIAGLAVDVGALYDQRDLRVEGTTLTQKTIQLPANARLGISLANVVGVFLCVGPQLNFNAGESTFYWEDLESYRHHFTLQETTIGFNLGGGVTLGKHLEASFYYNIPMGKTADLTWDTVLSTLGDQTMHRARSKQNAWRIAVAYYF